MWLSPAPGPWLSPSVPSLHPPGIPTTEHLGLHSTVTVTLLLLACDSEPALCLSQLGQVLWNPAWPCPRPLGTVASVLLPLLHSALGQSASGWGGGSTL